MAGTKSFTVFTKFAVKNGMTGPVLSMAKSVDKLAMRAELAKKTLTGMGHGIVKFGKFAAVGVGLVGTAAVMVGKQFSDAGAEVEKYKAQLRVMLGSQDAANQRFEELSKFAASTPFELNEVVQLGNQLQALGRYSEQNMTILGDLASAAGKPIDQVTGAFAKLASGQKGVAVDMFRDLLITTKDWSEATGKGVTKNGELMATTEEMLAALPKIMAKKKFSGMMAEQSKTFEGMASNLSDSVTRFKAAIGESLNTSLKKVMPKIQAAFEKMTAWANSNAERIGMVFDKVFEFVGRIGAALAPLWDAIQPVLKPIMEMIEPLFKIFENLMPVVTMAVGALAKILEPIAALIKWILEGIAQITGTMGSGGAPVARGGSAGVAGGNTARTAPRFSTPMSANTVPLSTSSSTTTTSKVELSVAPGVNAKQDKPAPGVTLATGQTRDFSPVRKRAG